MPKAFRIWIDVEEYDTATPDDGETVEQVDFGPSFVVIARDETETARSRARDRAVGFAEHLHDVAASLKAAS